MNNDDGHDGPNTSCAGHMSYMQTHPDPALASMEIFCITVCLLMNAHEHTNTDLQSLRFDMSSCSS